MALCYHCFLEKGTDLVCPHCGYDPSAAGRTFSIALSPGSILNGRYTVGRVLGKGGFGITYIALDYQSGERVAIKEYLPTEFAGRAPGDASVQVYSDEHAADFEYGRDQFLEEAKTLAAFLGDAHIVRIHRYFEENNTAYFVMEYVDGMPLNRYMQTWGGKLSVSEAGRLLLPVMNSLGHVHARGIIHRDVAPDNILVGKDGQAKLIDFGAARYSTGEKSKSLDVILKHGFAPKEQYMRRGRQGPWTDVYAMAATFYYAITGKVPPEALERQDADELALPHTLGADIGDAVEGVLLKALAVNASERYQSMAAFYTAMRDAIRAEQAERERKVRQAQEANERLERARQLRAEAEKAEREAREALERLELERRSREKAAKAGQPDREGPAHLEPTLQQQTEQARLQREKAERERRARLEQQRRAREAAVRDEQQRRGKASQSPEMHRQARPVAADAAEVPAAAPRRKRRQPLLLGAFASLLLLIVCAFVLNGRAKSAVTASAAPTQAAALILSEAAAPPASETPAATQAPVQEYRKVVDIVTMHYVNDCMVALLDDGTVKTAGLEQHMDQEKIDEIESWRDIVQVASVNADFLGLKSDGSVVSTLRDPEFGEPLTDPFDPNHWTDVRQLVTSEFEYYALTNDGRVLVSNDKPEASFGGGGPFMEWTDVEQILFFAYPESRGLVGLRADGTVLRASDYYAFTGDPTDVVAIDSSGYLTCAVRADGTVCVAGQIVTDESSSFANEAAALRDVVQAAAGGSTLFCRLSDGSVKVCPESHADPAMSTWPPMRDVQAVSNVLVGLGRDGRVYTAGGAAERFAELRQEAESWTDIVRIKAYDGTGYEDPYIIGWKYDGTVVAAGLDLSGLELNQTPAVRYTDSLIAAGGTVALREDGTVACAGLLDGDGVTEAVSHWHDIVRICALSEVLYGLRADGRVEAVFLGGVTQAPDSVSAEMDKVLGWRDITDIVSTGLHLVGLKADGSIVVSGPAHFGTEETADYSDWVGLVSLEGGISNGGEYLIGLKTDGVLVKGASLVGDWYGTPRRVVQTACSGYGLLCLEQDGSVSSIGFPGVTDWRRIRQVCVLDGLALGLGMDGTVFVDATGSFPDDMLAQIRGWTGIRALCTGPDNLVVGITEDGRTLVAENDALVRAYGAQCIGTIKGWTDLERILDVDVVHHVLALRTDGTLVSFGLPLPD